ncbi:MAG: peptidoglycan-associated lipoprotein Pal [Georgfuchsia sp.]
MRSSLAIAGLMALLLTACGSQPPAPEQQPAAVEEQQPAAPVVKSAPINSEIIDPYRLEALKDPKSVLSKRSVYFDFDQFIIKDEFKPLLEQHGKFLAANPQIKMRVQGNADERGSREYNIALGQKRAEVVKKTILLNGGKEDQVEAISLGKEKPRCTESTEECWAQNRRGDILYSGEF